MRENMWIKTTLIDIGEMSLSFGKDTLVPFVSLVPLQQTIILVSCLFLFFLNPKRYSFNFFASSKNHAQGILLRIFGQIDK